MKRIYYCPERPPMPGAIPKTGLLETGDDMCWPDDVFCWGWCIYDRKLTDAEVEEYELIDGGEIDEEGEAR